ncbi:MAG: hypothetical protein WKF84_30790 [Pyrinomonadaceae bacterium]
MKPNEEAQQIMQDFCASIDFAVEKSFDVTDAIACARTVIKLNLTLRLDIGNMHTKPLPQRSK